MKNNIIIRVASTEDAQTLLEIYRPYVEHTAITFEYDVPDIEEFMNRIKNTKKTYPYLVAEYQGEILGYAYAGAFKERALMTGRWRLPSMCGRTRNEWVLEAFYMKNWKKY